MKSTVSTIVSAWFAALLLAGCGNTSQTTSPSKTSSNRSQQTSSSQNQAKPKSIYIFSQSDLEMMYAMYYMGLIGPVHPPKKLQQIVWSYQGRVSVSMLKYVPAKQKHLDQQLVQQIVNFSTSGHMSSIKQLPGYEFKSFDKSQIPQYHNQTGTIPVWVPVGGRWASWDKPVVKPV